MNVKVNNPHWAYFEDLPTGATYVRWLSVSESEVEVFMKMGVDPTENGYVEEVIQDGKECHANRMSSVSLKTGIVDWEDPDQVVYPVNTELVMN